MALARYAEAMPRNPLVPRLQGLGTTIFAEMSALALATGSINLGQGFPDVDGPDVIKQAAVDAIWAGRNQYPPGIGVPELRQAIVEHQRRFYGVDLDADSEVLVTAGATEAVAAAMLAMVDTGDEVIALEPYYDSYAASIAMAGGVRVPVTLRVPDFRLDLERLRAAVTSRTKLILLNSPHNPTGTVLTLAELRAVAEVAIEHDLIVVTDEVYEHLVYDGQHLPISTLPGMAERTLTISSAGKTFALTGWKVGWATGPAVLVSAVRTTKQFLTYVNAAPMQPAIAVGLRLGDDFYATVAADLRRKRDLLCAGLADVGFEVFTPAGTYFVTTDVTPLGYDDGVAFCRDLPKRAGVVAIPHSVFYDNVEAGRSLVRFAFCKRDEVLTEAVTRLRQVSPR
jgi:N-succinyldiaminopimelate aminotransferase